MSFLGVRDEELRALGCVMVAGARLESVIRTIAVDLLVAPKKRQPGELLKLVREAASAGLPEHSRMSTSDELAALTQTASDALWERHLPAHSVAVRQATTEGWAGALVHLRTGHITGLDGARLMAVAAHVAEVTHDGQRLDGLLRHNPRIGVYLPNAVTDDGWPQPATRTRGRRHGPARGGGAGRLVGQLRPVSHALSLARETRRTALFSLYVARGAVVTRPAR